MDFSTLFKYFLDIIKDLQRYGQNTTLISSYKMSLWGGFLDDMMFFQSQPTRTWAILSVLSTSTLRNLIIVKFIHFISWIWKVESLKTSDGKLDLLEKPLPTGTLWVKKIRVCILLFTRILALSESGFFQKLEEVKVLQGVKKFPV